MSYEYVTDNNLYNKQNYMYSEYRGTDFLKDYLDSRHKFIDSIKSEGVDITVDSYADTVGQELMGILKKLQEGECSREIIAIMNAYTKSFEVRKRIYTGYDDNWKPIENAGFENYSSYILFADCLVHMYRHTKCLKYFSCLLKVDDTLLSVKSCLAERLKEYFSRTICQELDIFFQLMRENGIDREVVG